MKLNILPVFETTLPLTKKLVKFRPFVMKEEKILLMAAESDNTDDIISAINQAVMACTHGEVTCNNFPLVDIQYLFLSIRGKSVGEKMEFNLICGSCGAATEGSLHVDDVKIKTTDNHTHIINMSKDVEVVMKYPKIQHMAKLSQDTASFDDIYDVIAECIDVVKTPEEVYNSSTVASTEMREFIDNLTIDQFAKLKEFFDTMPVIKHKIDFTCSKCQVNNTIHMDNIVNFFV